MGEREREGKKVWGRIGRGRRRERERGSDDVLFRRLELGPKEVERKNYEMIIVRKVR